MIVQLAVVAACVVLGFWLGGFMIKRENVNKMLRK